jgi:vanillate O-demethylase ferredoxin subunit
MPALNDPSSLWAPASVAALRDLSPTVREITLRPAVPAAPWTVGSHLRVQVRHADGRLDERRYSLVGLPVHGADWRIAVKRASPGRGGSAFMWRLQVGDLLPVQPPGNHFALPTTAAPTLLVAGGIGITPMIGMALALAARRAEVQMRYAARGAEELVYLADLRAALGERLQTFVDARGERLDLDAEIAALPAQGLMLICGPVPLLHAAQEAWARAGRLPQRLRFETFGSSGNAPEQAFTVKVPRHGVDVLVPADRSLLDVLAENGVEVLNDCRRGECGLCAVDIVDLQGSVDHRDVFFSREEKRANHKLCACVSRAYGPGACLTLDSAWRPDELTA